MLCASAVSPKFGVQYTAGEALPMREQVKASNVLGLEAKNWVTWLNVSSNKH